MLSPELTEGPCHAKSPERKDISEGQPGLPLRLLFLVVDGACKPVKGATVEVWHAGPSGLYSTDEAEEMCNNGDAAARAARWFRGAQVTDAAGRVAFDTCYPGWYASRTVHLHFIVRSKGTQTRTSQLFFDDALNDEIIARQPLYDARGKKDVSNANDMVAQETSLAATLLQTRRLPDGSMLAWKTLVIHS